MLYEDNTSKLMGMEEVIIKKVDEEEGCRHIYIELPRRKHKCPCCGSETDRIHDYRMQKIKDCPAYGKNVLLHLRKRRYVCDSCGKRFFEDNSFLPKYCRITNRKYVQIIIEFRETVSATHIAKEHDISVSTALRYFDLVNYTCRELPEVLSIDEFKGNAGGEKYQTIITDAKNHKLIDILPNRKKSDLIKYFRSFDSRKQVKYVVIDMNKHFKDVAETCFPNATIVTDRYHVSRQAVWAMENVRKQEQKKLSPEWRKYCKNSRWLLSMPKEKLNDEQIEKLRTIQGLPTRIELAYDLKNDFLEMMHAPDSTTAKKLMADWICRAECSGLPEFNACTKALHNWSKYILNSFDCPYSNGYTEGCNNKTKVLKRTCYGVRNFRRFRNRILHCAA